MRHGVSGCLLLLATLVVTGCGSATRPGSPTAHPSTMTVNGVIQYRVLGRPSISGVIVDPTDDRRLMVLASRDRPTQSRPEPALCAPASRPFAYVAKLAGNSAVLGSGGYVPEATSSTHGKTYYVYCSYETIGTYRLPVVLGEPLGHRILLDAYGTRVTTVTDRSVPTPAYVPPGYRAAGLDLVDGQPLRRYRHGAQELDVSVLDRSIFPVDLRPTAGQTVHGQPAEIADEQSLRTVTWRDSVGHLVRVTSLLAAGGHRDTGLAELSTQDLLRVARSI